MSIERSIERLAEAVENLTVALGDSAIPSVAPAPEPKAEKPAPEPKAEKPKAEKPKPAPEPKAEAAIEASLTDVSTALKDLMKDHGRDAAVAVLGKFKAANVKALKPDQFTAVIEAAKGYTS